MTKKFKISTIIPIYKVEEYLEETIESVINQSIGFDNIQLILVNDGSPDNSEEICFKYKEKYPENVIYIKQKNSGVSAARNNGLKHATAPVINFLDSDDIWEKTAYEEGLNLLEENQKITSVIYPIKFFDASSGNHPLNYMFNDEKKFFDIREDYQNIKLQSCSLIMKKEILKGKEFSNELKISEDARFLCEVFMDSPHIGKAKSFYLYRKRKNGTSAIQTSTQKKTWYLDTSEKSYKYIMDLSEKKYGEVLKFIQCYILYDFKWRMNISSETILSKQENQKYIETMKYCLNKIEDEIIADYPLLNALEKQYAINFKYNSKANYQIIDDELCINKKPICQSKEVPVFIDNVYEKNGQLQIYGRMPIIKNVIEKVYLKNQQKEKIYFSTYVLDEKNKYLKTINKEDNFEYLGIKLSLDLNKNNEYVLMAEGKKEYKLNYSFTYSSTLNNRFKSIYLRTPKHYVYYKKQKLHIKKKNILRKIILDLKCDYNLLKKKRIKSFIYRKCAGIARIFKTKKIWIISDRIQVAGDNGEAFFDYVSKTKIPNTKCYFAISKNSKDYKRLKNKYKNVIRYHSWKHKMLHLNADKIISAQADDYVTNPFGRSKYYIADLYRYKFIFLQHGITINDLSAWLNVNSKKIDMFVTSALEEYKSIISNEYKYNYDKEVVKLTGMPRYDKLLNNDYKLKKQIVIMPTWRKSLTSNVNVKDGTRKYNEEFRKTEYFKFYNSLINNEKLITTLKKKGYKIKFIPHANMMSQIDDFDKNDYVDFSNGVVDYSREFKENSLLITDYSSVCFDFAYLKKPIIMAQFDQENFYEGQIYNKGYFDYEQDGFGKVTKTLDETIKEIIKIIENDCKMEKKYIRKVEKFYKYTDKKNCERVYEEISKL